MIEKKTGLVLRRFRNEIYVDKTFMSKTVITIIQIELVRY